MARWFDNKFISREEHYAAIASYQSHIAQLEKHIRDKQAEIDAHNLQELLNYGQYRVDREVQRVRGIPISDLGDNVISFHARRRSNGSS